MDFAQKQREAIKKKETDLIKEKKLNAHLDYLLDRISIACKISRKRILDSKTKYNHTNYSKRILYKLLLEAGHSKKHLSEALGRSRETIYLTSRKPIPEDYIELYDYLKEAQNKWLKEFS